MSRNLIYQPVLKHGVPDCSPWEKEYQTFWKEQIRRCLEGYKPAGHAWIPGRYYFYLNFLKIYSAYNEKGLEVKRKILTNPFYRDIDHEYFDKVEEAKKNGKGLIVLKARRKGQTMCNIGGVCIYEMTMSQKAEVGLGCYTEEQVNSFRSKYETMYSSVHEFFRQNTLVKNNAKIQYGETNKIEGVDVVQGNQSAMYFRDFYNKTGSFRGESLDFLLFEEAGENPLLKSALLVSEECFREGDHQFGVPIIFGTSNEIKTGVKDLQELYYESEKYNLLRYFIPASKAYYPFIDLKTGISDTEKAEKAIQKKRDEKNKLEDKLAYYTYLQEMPLKDSDCFVLGASNVFDLAKIHGQIEFIMEQKVDNVQRGRLEWLQNAEGAFLREVEWVPDPHGMMHMLYQPLEDNSMQIDVAGVDSYTKDQSVQSDSLGSVHVFRGTANLSTPDDMPIFEYVDRPNTKEEFYDNCAKIAVYYKCKLLIEDTDEQIFSWFVTNGLSKYLKEAPIIYKTVYAKASNKYGYTISGTGKKAKLVDSLADYIKSSCHKIFFKELLKEMMVFGLKNTDRCISMGLALIHAKDNEHIKMVGRTVADRTKQIKLPTFRRVGGMIIKGYGTTY